MKKKLYKTVIQIEVLSEDPILDTMSVQSIEDECDNGDYSGMHTWITTNEVLEGQAAADATMKQGSSPDFFGMDENGNEF
jgi:hypothetical protein